MNLQDLTPVAWLIPGTVTKDAALARVNGKNATPLYTRDDLCEQALAQQDNDTELLKQCLITFESLFTSGGVKVWGLGSSYAPQAAIAALRERLK